MRRAAAAQATRRPGLSRLRQAVCVEVVRQQAVRVVRGPAMNSPNFSQRCASVCEMHDMIGGVGMREGCRGTTLTPTGTLEKCRRATLRAAGAKDLDVDQPSGRKGAGLFADTRTMRRA
jgi:hypothetical protein